MIWLFLLGIVVLMVMSRGFRKVGFWIAGICAALFAALAIYSESTGDPLRGKRAQLAECILAAPGGLGFRPDAPYVEHVGEPQMNEQQLDRAIVLCHADWQAYKAQQEAERNSRLGLPTGVH
jgi:hypothetical protein